MTWFLRKSLRFGPLRLNLSKRGVGASVGVKGARIGVDASGKPYAAGGRGGLYFRTRLGGGRRDGSVPELPPTAPPGAPPRTSALVWWLIGVALVVGLLVGFLVAGGTMR